MEKETVVGLGSTRGTVGTPSTIQTVIKAGVVQEVPAVVEGRRVSLPVVAAHDASVLERRKTIASAASRESGTQSSLTASTSASDERPRDTLDREFIESGIDALRRVSNGPDMSLPSWPITKWVLFFSLFLIVDDLFVDSKLTWTKKSARSVLAISPQCIKVPGANAPSPSKFRHHDSPQGLHARSHPNVLELFGATSATGEPCVGG